MPSFFPFFEFLETIPYIHQLTRISVHLLGIMFRMLPLISWGISLHRSYNATLSYWRPTVWGWRLKSLLCNASPMYSMAVRSGENGSGNVIQTSKIPLWFVLTCKCKKSITPPPPNCTEGSVNWGIIRIPYSLQTFRCLVLYRQKFDPSVNRITFQLVYSSQCIVYHILLICWWW